MLRVLAWWIYGQALDLLKLWVSKGGYAPNWLQHEIEYFAFGANLSQEVLQTRRINPIQSNPFALREHTLEFTQAGPFEGSAFASVKEKAGGTVYGELMSLTRLDLWRMHYVEVVPFLKKHRVVPFQQDGNKGVFYQATTNIPGLLPTRAYLDKIYFHAKKNPLAADEYVRELEVHAVASEETLAKDIFFAIDYRNYKGPWRNILRGYDRVAVFFFIRLMEINLFRRFI